MVENTQATMNNGRTLTLSIMRYNPEKDDKPYMQEFSVATEDCKGVMLLDALELIKAKYDSSLSFRRSYVKTL